MTAPIHILASAIRIGHLVFAFPKPARHHHLIWWMRGVQGGTRKSFLDWWPNRTALPTHEQGFITSTGMFVDRAVALEIATNAQQLIGPPRGVLFSEEVW